MEVKKNMLGKGIKIHADEIVVGAQDNYDTLSNALQNFKIVASGQNSGTVVNNLLLEPDSIYLFLIGRDQGLYLISAFGGVTVTAIAEQYGLVDITTNGNYLTIDFRTRTRPYVLVRFR